MGMGKDLANLTLEPTNPDQRLAQIIIL